MLQVRSRLESALDIDLPNQRSIVDEQVWTLLFVAGFFQQGDGAALLYSALTGEAFMGETCKCWLEMLPQPPRKGVKGRSESNSEIDISLGALSTRDGTKSGLEYGGDGGICLVECKWLSDLSTHTTHDPVRNQLARVIESAVTLQSFDASTQTILMPDDIHVTLLTPSWFRDEAPRSRFYGFLVEDYNFNTRRICEDIESCQIPARTRHLNWQYPNDLAQRVSKVRLHWVTYKDLFRRMPDSGFKDKLGELLHERGGRVGSREVS